MRILPITIITILVTRILGALAIAFFPSIYFDKFYHLYYGLILFALASFLAYFSKKFRLILVGIGLGLIVDDIAVVQNFIYGASLDPISTYWSPTYIIPLLLGLFLISLFEEKLKSWIR